MGFTETKMINSDFINEPLNYLMYIDSIEKYEDNSYMFDQDDVSKKKFRELISKSTLLYTHRNIHQCLFRNLKSDDLYYFFKIHKNLGDCLNLLHGEGYFSTGNFDNVCEYMNMEAIRIMNDEFLHGFGLVVQEKLESEDAFEWINTRFGVDLSSYDSLSSVILDTEGWKLMLSSSALMACCSTTQWFNKKVVEPVYKRIWRTSSGDYYDDNGIHYTSEGEPDGKDIATDALEMMKTNNLVLEEYLTIMDSAYQRLKDALYWFAQHESVSALKNYRELLEIFVADENCCQYLSDYPDVLTDCLEDLEFANQIFGSELAFNKIASSHDATEAMVNFIAGIQTSYDALSTIKDSLYLIPENSGKIYDSDALKDTVNDTLDHVNQTMIDIVACQKFNNTTQDLINSYTSDETFASRLFSNTNFVTWCTENETFVRNFVDNEVMITALCTNEVTMPIACQSSTFCNAMAASSVAIEAIIANTNALNTVVASSVAIEAIIANTNALNTVVASSVAMNAVAASSVAMNAVAASSVAMNAVAASSVAREAIIASDVAYKAVTDSDMAVAKFAVGAAGLDPADYANMSVVAASSVAIGAIASSTTAKNAVLASTTALNALDTSPLAKTMSSAGTVTGKGFVISYSVQSGLSTNCAGGYSVTIDTVVASAGVINSSGSASNRTASDKHRFFTSNIGLTFSTGTWDICSATGSGSMKYILGT